MTTRTLPALFAALAALTAWAPAARADKIILEAYAGERPADAGELLGPVIDALGEASYAPPAEAVRRIEAGVSTPGRLLSGDELEEARRFVESGYEQFVAGSFELAIRDLERGLDILRRSPATLARQQEERDTHMRGLIGLSLAHKRLGHATRATAAMAELLRTFPDKEISYREYGPEPRDFYEKVQEDLLQQGLGSLTVEVDDDNVVVFVNERYVGVGEVTLRKLIPGRYRIFLQQGERPGRVHEVDVEAGSRASLSLPWALDEALQTGGGRPVLAFPGEVERAELEGRYAARIGRAAGADGVAVLGIREHRGRRSVIGSYYALDSDRPERTAVVSVEPAAPSGERLRALGRFLAGDEAAAELVEEVDPDEVPVAPRAARDGPGASAGGSALGVWKWVTLGAGIAGLAAGGTLIAVHEPRFNDDGTRNDVARNTRPAGIGVGIAGLALTGLGVYFFLADDGGGERRGRERAISIVPTDGGAAFAIGGRF